MPKTYSLSQYQLTA